MADDTTEASADSEALDGLLPTTDDTTELIDYFYNVSYNYKPTTEPYLSEYGKYAKGFPFWGFCQYLDEMGAGVSDLIAAMNASGKTVKEKRDYVKELQEKLTNFFLKIWNSLCDGAYQLFKAVIEKIQALIDVIKKLGESLVQELTDAITGLLTAFEEFLGALQGVQIPEGGGSVTEDLGANPVTVSTDSDWLTVTCETNSSGNTVVTYTAGASSSFRETKVTVSKTINEAGNTADYEKSVYQGSRELNFFNTLKDKFDKLSEELHLKDLRNPEDVWNAIVEEIFGAIMEVYNKIAGFFNKLVEMINSFIKTVQGIIDTLEHEIKDTVQNLLDQFLSVVDTMLEPFWQIWQALFDSDSTNVWTVVNTSSRTIDANLNGCELTAPDGTRWQLSGVTDSSYSSGDTTLSWSYSEGSGLTYVSYNYKDADGETHSGSSVLTLVSDSNDDEECAGCAARVVVSKVQLDWNFEDLDVIGKIEKVVQEGFAQLSKLRETFSGIMEKLNISDPSWDLRKMMKTVITQPVYIIMNCLWYAFWLILYLFAHTVQPLIEAVTNVAGSLVDAIP